MKVMPAASSQAAVQQQDAIADEEGMDSNALANRAQGDGAEGSVFEEQHLALQAETKGNMHVCMIQGPCLESESLFTPPSYSFIYSGDLNVLGKNPASD